MDTVELGNALLDISPQKRDEYHKLLADPVFVPVYNYKTWDETRDHPERKMRAIVKSKVVSILDFENDPHNIFAAHEFWGMTDCSLAIKFTV